METLALLSLVSLSLILLVLPLQGLLVQVSEVELLLALLTFFQNNVNYSWYVFGEICFEGKPRLSSWFPLPLNRPLFHQQAPTTISTMATFAAAWGPTNFTTVATVETAAETKPTWVSKDDVLGAGPISDECNGEVSVDTTNTMIDNT